MNYQLLGRSGLCVSDLCLGAMTFGEGLGLGHGQGERPVGVHFRA
jgi:aryl-alcohol dehydrogenase-like predicted oxidoreductase